MISREPNNVAPLLGLVLAGGKSVRMGEDKGAIKWNGVEQRYHMVHLLQHVCVNVYISCRNDQKNEMAAGYNTIVDSYSAPGPLAGILSAFQQHPHAAWLVTACDLPLLDLATLQSLVQHRDPSCIATTFQSPFDGLPEPLITIWEPSATEKLQEHINAGYSCPRKALIRNSEIVKVLVPPDGAALTNANTPEDAAKIIINK